MCEMFLRNGAIKPLSAKIPRANKVTALIAGFRDPCPFFILRFTPRRDAEPPRIPRSDLYYTALMAHNSDRSFTDSLTSAKRTTFYEGHKPLAVGMILVVFFLPFVGLLAGGLFGVAGGVVLSLLAYYLTPYAVQKFLSRNQARP
jgi:hypothetical protein